MVEDRPAGSVSEAITTVTGGSKPVHRFLRGQPKSIGVVLVVMGIGLFMFAIPMNVQSDVHIGVELLTPFWLGTLFFICGLLYILSERNPSKKMITASFALSIISVIGVLPALVEFFRAISVLNAMIGNEMYENNTVAEELYAEQYHMTMKNMEVVFVCHSLAGGVLLVIMTFFARAALRSSRTQPLWILFAVI